MTIQSWSHSKFLASFHAILMLLPHLRHLLQLRLPSSCLLALPLNALIDLKFLLLTRCKVQLIIFWSLKIMYPIPVICPSSLPLAVITRLFHAWIIYSLLLSQGAAPLFFFSLIISRPEILRLAVLINFGGIYCQERPRFRRPLVISFSSTLHLNY